MKCYNCGAELDTSLLEPGYDSVYRCICGALNSGGNDC